MLQDGIILSYGQREWVGGGGVVGGLGGGADVTMT